MPKQPTRQRAVLEYQVHWFDPEDLLTFIELRPFTRRWEGPGLDEKDLQALQVILMTNPKRGDVIEGSGGLRKLRFSPPKSAKGKSGGLRICYSYIEEIGTVILALVYEKGEKDDLTEAELKTLRSFVDRVKALLLSKPYRRQDKIN